MIEQTLVLIKPDGVKKGLIGKIVARLEDTGLRVCAMKMIWPDDKLAKNHYPLEEQWAKSVFKKAKTTAEREKRKFEHKDHMKFGERIQSALREYIRESPVVAIVIKGPHAVGIVRKLVGNTEPRQAIPGTIRADLASVESYEISDAQNRAIKNLIHASDSIESAKREISLWFTPKEIHEYE